MGTDRGLAQPDRHPCGSGSPVLLPLRSEDRKIWRADSSNDSRRRHFDAAWPRFAYLSLRAPYTPDAPAASGRSPVNHGTRDSAFSTKRFQLRRAGGLAVRLSDGGVALFRPADLHRPDLHRLSVSSARAG